MDIKHNYEQWYDFKFTQVLSQNLGLYSSTAEVWTLPYVTLTDDQNSLNKLCEIIIAWHIKCRQFAWNTH